LETYEPYELIKMETINKRLFLTGASGLLGRAVYKKFVNEGWTVYGTAYSR
jgi:nucleoside-diphosphate-sugar epimerase